MTKFILVDLNGNQYIDPFTSKIAKFDDFKTAQITSFMLFDQQSRQFKVIENWPKNTTVIQIGKLGMCHYG